MIGYARQFLVSFNFLTSFEITFKKKRAEIRIYYKIFEVLTASSAMSFRYGISLPFLFVRRISFVSHVNVLAVGLRFRLIHWLDEVPSVISLHVANLRVRGVIDNNMK